MELKKHSKLTTTEYFTKTLRHDSKCASENDCTLAGLSVSSGDEALVTHTHVGSRQVLTEGVFPAHCLVSTLVNI